jgi:hypothetical protein
MFALSANCSKTDLGCEPYVFAGYVGFLNWIRKAAGDECCWNELG